MKLQLIKIISDIINNNEPNIENKEKKNAVRIL